MFEVAIFAAGVFGGAVASLAGFGIGSLLTPAVSLTTGTKLAVAAVAIPHAIGTSLRFWRLRDAVDWKIVRSFGLTSAAGGLAGALLNTVASSRALAIVFGCLLVFAGASQLAGKTGRWRLRGALTWIGGALSGFFGGLVGNQGGIRSAAMLGFDVDKRRFVATATAVALLVDLARVPVYLIVEREALVRLLPVLAIATAGVLIGTIFGERMLAGIPEQRFRTVVGALLIVLGVSFFLAYAGQGSDPMTIFCMGSDPMAKIGY